MDEDGTPVDGNRVPVASSSMIWWYRLKLKFPFVKMQVRALKQLARTGEPQAIPPLIESLFSKKWAVYTEAMQAMATLGEKPVQYLEPLLKHEDPYVRARSLEALTKCVASLAIGSLIGALDDTDRTVRCIAIDGIGKLRAKSAVPQLLQCLRDSDAMICRSAIAALGTMREKSAVEPLISMLYSKGMAEDTSTCVARALSLIQDPRAIEPLGQILSNSRVPTALREEVATALAAFLNLRDYQRVLRVLASIHLYPFEIRRFSNLFAAEWLVSKLKDDSESIRRTAGEVLADLGIQVLPILLAVVKEPAYQNWEVMQLAVDLVTRLPSEHARQIYRDYPDIAEAANDWFRFLRETQKAVDRINERDAWYRKYEPWRLCRKCGSSHCLCSAPRSGR